MASSKAFLLGLVFAVLLISSEVSAASKYEETTVHGHGGNGHGHGGHGHGHHGKGAPGAAKTEIEN
ncbi:hypothetical protein ACE6H2_015026 [Prunus campanulata]